MAKAYNISRISYLFCYGIEDICNLFKARKLHPQTVRTWFKNGLKAIDDKKPSLVYGYELKRFLGKLNDDHKLELAFDEFYCFSCKQPCKPYKGLVYIEQTDNLLKAKAICPKTKKIINRNYKLTDYPELKKNFNLTEMSRLYDSLNPPLKTQISDNGKTGLNESINQGEFNYDK